jgi:hypothetical protein
MAHLTCESAPVLACLFTQDIRDIIIQSIYKASKKTIFPTWRLTLKLKGTRGQYIRTPLFVMAGNQRRQDLLAMLSKIGLEEQEAEVYLRILDYQMERRSAVPVALLCGGDEIQELVSRFQELGLVFESLSEYGIPIVHAIDPVIASRSLFSRLLWETCPSETMIQDLEATERDRLAKLKDLAMLIEKELASYYFHPQSTEAVVAIDQHSISEELAAALRSAHHVMLGVTAPIWTPRIDLVWETIKERIESGVEYYRLADPCTFVSFGHSINKRDVLEVGVQLRILPRGRIQEKFFVVDENLAFIFWPPDPASRFPLEASKTTIPIVVSREITIFEHLWALAVPAEQLFPEMERIRSQFAEECDRALGISHGRLVGEQLFDYGKFCFRTGTLSGGSYDPSLVQRLLDLELAVPCPGEQDSLIPNVLTKVELIVEHLQSTE